MVGRDHRWSNIGATAQKAAEDCWKLVPAGFCRLLQFLALSCAASPGGLSPPGPPQKARSAR
eukprot:818239-Alexandrium_andersonii.AAC.1